MQTIRAWLKTNPDLAKASMNRNESLYFLSCRRGDGSAIGAFGAEGVPLTPNRSLAVGKSRYGLGIPSRLETTVPIDKEGALAPIRRRVTAQDTVAIKSRLHGDAFWGSGEEVANIAGRMDSPQAGDCFRADCVQIESQYRSNIPFYKHNLDRSSLLWIGLRSSAAPSRPGRSLLTPPASSGGSWTIR